MLFFYLLLQLVLVVAESNSYAPKEAKCPPESLLREANTISQMEKKWLQGRHIKTNQALISYLNRAGLKDFDAVKFINEESTKPINIGVTLSGGSYKAALVDAGEIAALDDRVKEANEFGLGGVLQATSYISGLSGGSWVLGSLAMQDWPSIEEVIHTNPHDTWNLTATRQTVNGTGVELGIYPVLSNNTEKFSQHLNNWVYDDVGIGYDIEQKQQAGFPTNLIDAYGRSVAYQFLPEGEDNFMVSSTWSDLREKHSFRNYDMPFPIVQTVGRDTKTKYYGLNSTVYEFNPYEMGSFDGGLNAFTDLKYIGTNVSNGIPQDHCIEGYDNVGFVMGSSSAIFNAFKDLFTCAKCPGIPQPAKGILNKFFHYLSETNQDVGIWEPNPFKDSEYTLSLIKHDKNLQMIDGGLGGDTISLSTILTKQRQLDTLFAFDNFESWPSGNSLIQSYERQFTEQGKSMVLPYVPDAATFIHNNLTAKPTFFGCDGSNQTELIKDDVVPPLVIYIANRPYSFYTNTSLLKFSYTDEEKKAMYTNGFEIASRLNSTIDEQWPKCVGCAMIKREQERQGIQPSEECQQCFSDYCWDGSIYQPIEPLVPPVNFTDSGLTNLPMSLINDKNITTYGPGIANLLKLF